MPPVAAIARGIGGLAGGLLRRRAPDILELDFEHPMIARVPFITPLLGRLRELQERALAIAPPEVRRRHEARRAVRRWILYGEGDPEAVRQHAAFLREERERERRALQEELGLPELRRRRRIDWPYEPLIHHSPPEEIRRRFRPPFIDAPLIYPHEWIEQRINARRVRRPRRVMHPHFVL